MQAHRVNTCVRLYTYRVGKVCVRFNRLLDHFRVYSTRSCPFQIRTCFPLGSNVLIEPSFLVAFSLYTNYGKLRDMYESRVL